LEKIWQKNEHLSAFVGIWLPNVVLDFLVFYFSGKRQGKSRFFMQKEIQNKMLELF